MPELPSGFNSIYKYPTVVCIFTRSFTLKLKLTYDYYYFICFTKVTNYYIDGIDLPYVSYDTIIIYWFISLSPLSPLYSLLSIMVVTFPTESIVESVSTFYLLATHRSCIHPVSLVYRWLSLLIIWNCFNLLLSQHLALSLCISLNMFGYFDALTLCTILLLHLLLCWVIDSSNWKHTTITLFLLLLLLHYTPFTFTLLELLSL